MKNKLLHMVIVLLFNSQLRAQCLIFPVDLKTHISESTHVLEGELQYVETEKDDYGRIYSFYKLVVYKSFKGGILDSVLIRSFGGTVGLEMAVSYPSDDLKNDYGIFFLKKASDFFELTATTQSKIWVNNQEVLDVFDRYENYQSLINQILLYSEKVIEIKEKTWQIKTSSKRLTPVISQISPSRLTAGTDSILSIIGSDFNSSQGSGSVQFSDANSGGSSFIAPLASQYVSWTDTLIQVKLPTRAGTGVFRVTNSDPITTTSSFNLIVPYNLINLTSNPGSGNRQYFSPLQGLNTGGSMLFSLNSRFYDSTRAKNDFITALEKWRCTTLVNFDTVASTTNTDIASNNSENVVAWDFNNALSLGVLGTAYSYYSGCGSGSSVTWRVVDLDVVFNDIPFTNFNWQYGPASPSSSQFDFESVALHELGHSHQLGHVIDANQTMHFSISNGQQKNTISKNDSLAGINVVSKSGVSICSSTAMSALVNSSCSYTALPLDGIELIGMQWTNSIQLKWMVNHAYNIQKYVIEKSMDGNHFFEIGRIENEQTIGSTFEYNDYFQINHSILYYRILVYENNLPIAYSNIIEFTSSQIKPIFFIHSTNDERMLINSNVDINHIKSLLLLNALGQEIPFIKDSQSVLVRSVPSGVYFIQYEYFNKIYYQKIVF
jgi:hypothetical protein